MTNWMSRTALVGILAAGMAGCGTIADPSTWGPDKPVNPPAELVDLNPSFEPAALWSHNTGKGSGDLALNLRPAVDGDSVYLADFGGRIESLGLETGAFKWDANLDATLSGGPGVGGNLVVVGTMNAEVIAVDAQSGEVRWRADVSGEVLSVPLVGADTVVVHSLDGHIYGLDATSGAQRWSYVSEVPVLTLRGSSSPVAVGASAVICGLANGKIVALDLATGRELWVARVSVPSGRSELERMADVDGDPLVFENTLYAGSYQGDVAAVGVQSGLLLWRTKLSSYSRIAGAAGRLFVATDNGDLNALDPENGAILWTNDQLRNRRLSDVAVLGDVVAVGDFEGYLHFFNAADGAMVGRTRVGSAPITTGMLVHEGVLLVQGQDGSVAAMRSPDR